MNVIAEASSSVWMSTAMPSAPHLIKDEETETVIIGAGMTGLSVAYELALLGRKVVVIDMGLLAGGMTSRTTAHLTYAFDYYFKEYIRLRGEDEARLYYKSQRAAVDRLEEIQKLEKIDCEFRRLDAYLFPDKMSDENELKDELAACHKIGFRNVSFVDKPPFEGDARGRTLKFTEQAAFHPLKYLAGLIPAIQRKGGVLYSNSPVVDIREEAGGVTVETKTGAKIRAAQALVATNSPINNLVALHTKQAPYRTYVLGTRIKKGTVTDALYWDTHDPYHYVRPQPADDETDWLIIGGEDHKSGEENDAERRFKSLETWARQYFPEIGKIEHRWSGQTLEPVDYIPYVGLNPGNKNIYVVTGSAGKGITTGAAAGLILRDLMTGKDNPWAKAYDPSRITLMAAGEYLTENRTMVANMCEHLTGGEVDSEDDIKPGEGALLREGIHKVAAYRDDSGHLHKHSAVCTHVGCIVHWNSWEKCWDCPCHGSQFAPTGEVLNGPAKRPLARLE